MSKKNESLETVIARGASRPWRMWAIIILVLAAIGGGAWYFHNKEETERNGNGGYVTEPAATDDISLIVTAAGSLAPTNQVVIGSELSGTVQEVYVETNDTVKKGDRLAKLDTLKLDQQAARSRASLAAAKARVSQIKATLLEVTAALARQEELHEISGGKTPSRATMETSKASVARAKADLESAEAAVSGAQAEVGAIERDLAKATVCSPVDGVVLSRSIEVGQTVAASFTAPTLFTIAEDLKTMRLWVSVVEADIGRVERGQTATFSVDAWPGRTYTAKVKKVALGSNSDNNAGGGGGNGGNNAAAAAGGVVSYRTELQVANDDLSLRPGMTATVDISIVEKKDILVVPNSALRFDPDLAEELGKPLDTGDKTLIQNLTPSGGRRWSAMRRQFKPDADKESQEPGVWILKDGKHERLTLQTGITDGLVTEITGGDLKEGMEVIVSINPQPKA